jgi:hypothetical protein
VDREPGGIDGVPPEAATGVATGRVAVALGVAVSEVAPLSGGAAQAGRASRPTIATCKDKGRGSQGGVIAILRSVRAVPGCCRLVADCRVPALAYGQDYFNRNFVHTDPNGVVFKDFSGRRAVTKIALHRSGFIEALMSVEASVDEARTHEIAGGDQLEWRLTHVIQNPHTIRDALAFLASAAFGLWSLHPALPPYMLSVFGLVGAEPGLAIRAWDHGAIGEKWSFTLGEANPAVRLYIEREQGPPLQLIEKRLASWFGLERLPT